jgi:site-specific DNA recombinase
MSEPVVVVPPPVRCAVYTRKSTEEGLDKEFNSLDAQREAAEAFILSQRQEGWLTLAHPYDDGGFTGANMERPALAKLLADIEAGRIDCVVVYKVDRLSRSLLDFARMMSLFEQHGVSFVSVTQQFNTRTPVGRLTMNILLSFAQFERDIISERTRDKKAAAKRKGKWTGGYLPLGYDLDPQGSKLRVNVGEAEQVCAIFELFSQNGSLSTTVEELQRRRWQTKSWVTEKQKSHAGSNFTEGSLGRLLSNEVYAGAVHYKDKSYRGEHPRIVEAGLWRRVQRLLLLPQIRPPRQRPNQPGALLQGILDCGSCGRPMSHTYTCRGERRYRYYVCRDGHCTGQTVAATAFESSVIEQLRNLTGRKHGAKLRSFLNALGTQPQPDAEAIRHFQEVMEKVTYDGRTGSVVIRLRRTKGKASA